MKKNEISDLKTRTVDELHKMLFDLREEVIKSTVEAQSGKLSDTNKIRRYKKDIARVLTFLHIKKYFELGKELNG